MNCPNCNAPLEEGALFCPNCGTPVQTAAAQPEEPVYEEPQQEYQPQYEQAPVQEEAKPFPVKLAALAGAAVVGLIVLIAVIANLFSGSGKKNMITAIQPSSEDAEVLVISEAGNKIFKKTVDSSVSSSYYSLDSSMELIRTSGKILYYVQANKIEKIAEEVTNAWISDDGSTAVYISDGSLYVAKIGKKGTKIAGSVVTNSICVAPDGSAVGYAVQSEDDASVLIGYIWDGGKEATSLGKNKVAIALASKAQYVYYVRLDDNNAMYVQKKYNDETKVKLNDTRATLYLNQDHTVCYLYNGEKTVYCAKAGEKQSLFSYSVTLKGHDLKSKSNSVRGTSAVTYNVKNFTNQFFYNASNERIIRLNNKLEAETVAKSSSTLYVAADGKTIVYYYNEKIRQVNGSKTDPEPVDLVSEIKSSSDLLGVLEDGKTICYMKDKEFFVQKGTAKPVKLLDEEPDDLQIYNGKVILYCIDNVLYGSTGGKATKYATFSDDIVTISSNGKMVVVALKDKSVQFSTDAKKFVKLYE